MITIGGIIAGDKIVSAVVERISQLAFDFVSGAQQFVIDVPHLTFKEKLALDRILPKAQVPSIADVEKLGFPLKQAQIDSYYKFYRYYPTFAEMTQ